MKVCMHCLTEYLDEYNYCSDCKGPLTKMSESKKRMLYKIKNPAKLTSLENIKETELLETLLSIENINCFVVDSEKTEWGEKGSQEIFVEESKLERALLVLEEFQLRIKELRDFAEKKSRMIKPSLLVTVGKEIQVNPWELACFLEERHIKCCYETVQDFVMGWGVVVNGIRSGKNVSLSDFYVDEMYLSEAQNAVEDFLKYQNDIEDNAGDDEESYESEMTGDAELEDEEPLSGNLLNWFGKLLK